MNITKICKSINKMCVKHFEPPPLSHWTEIPRKSIVLPSLTSCHIRCPSFTVFYYLEISLFGKNPLFSLRMKNSSSTEKKLLYFCNCCILLILNSYYLLLHERKNNMMNDK